MVIPCPESTLASRSERRSMTDTQPTPSVREVNDPVDGRTLRRTRNRTAVITALLDMIREGDLHPGAAEIAERAGVSHRSIFRYFDDLDDLVRTAIDQAFQDAEPLSRITDIGRGTLEDRVRVYVDERLALYDYVNGPMQVARMRASSIPSIDEEIAVVAEAFRAQIAEHFATELGALPEARSGRHRQRHPGPQQLRRVRDPHDIAGERSRSDAGVLEHRTAHPAPHLSGPTPTR